MDALAGKKILFASMPADGHVNPLTGLAKYLQSQGCDVRWYTGFSYAPKMAKLNIPLFPFRRALEITADNLEEFYPERKNINGQVKKLVFDMIHYFIEQAPRFIEDLKDIQKEFPFDVVVAECTFTAIPLVKKELEVPVIGIGIVPLTETSRIFSEREQSSYNSVDGFADILGYEGKAGDHWDYEAKYERRHLDNASTRRMDGSANQNLLRTNTFNTVSGALAYADHKKLRARTSLEVRRDQDAPRLMQWVSRNSIEYHLNQDWSILSKLDYGKTYFLEPHDTPADFMEFSSGFAYRPVDNDRLNMLGRYTYLRNIGNDYQFNPDTLYKGIETYETSHIIAMDLGYDLNKYLGMVEKVAYKNAIAGSSVSNEAILHTILLAHRFNFHVTRKWDVALEYRVLFQADAAETLKHGALAEVDREIYDYARLGIGYNFTDFSDDLRKIANYSSHGPFVRLTGKF